jgi:catechol 2,3-dioxygenase-like lactoylglutathione lyase family enzyme
MDGASSSGKNISSTSITGISHSGFYVDNLDRCIEFYTKVLGAKLEWRQDNNPNPLIKLYVGDFGLSIITRPKDEPKREIPHSIHWAYRVDPDKAEETIAYIKSCGVEVEGPIPHRREVGLCSWFFVDPDDHRLEIEAKFASNEVRNGVVERAKGQENRQLGMHGADETKRKMF